MTDTYSLVHYFDSVHPLALRKLMYDHDSIPSPTQHLGCGLT